MLKYIMIPTIITIILLGCNLLHGKEIENGMTNSPDRFYETQMHISNPETMAGDSIILFLKEHNLWKNSYKAFALSIVPGILLHGFGHIYAEKTKTFKILLALEGLSLLIIPAGMSLQGITSSDPGGREFAVGLTYILFFGTWIYDVIGAPIQCTKYNSRKIEEYKNKVSISPFLQNSTNNSVLIGFKIDCSF